MFLVTLGGSLAGVAAILVGVGISVSDNKPYRQPWFAFGVVVGIVAAVILGAAVVQYWRRPDVAEIPKGNLAHATATSEEIQIPAGSVVRLKRGEIEILLASDTKLRIDGVLDVTNDAGARQSRAKTGEP